MATKRILIPTDFSENAIQAAEYALENLNYPDTEFMLYHAYQLPHYGAVISSDLDNILKDDRTSDMQKFEKTLRLKYPDCKIKGYISQGSLGQLIAQLTEKFVFNGIVMGTKGATNAGSILLGSNATLVLKKTKLLLYLIPGGEKPVKAPKSVLLASDYQLNETNETFQPLIDLLKKHHSKLHILNLCDCSQSNDILDAQSTLDEMFLSIPHHFHIRNKTDVKEDILNFAESREIDLITIVAHQYSFMENLFHKSISKRISLYATQPVLILKD